VPFSAGLARVLRSSDEKAVARRRVKVLGWMEVALEAQLTGRRWHYVGEARPL
jgi:hypothetical protein